MGWLTKRFDQWCLKRQHDDNVAVCHASLRAMDGKELGTVVAFATGIRHGLESDAHLVIDPIVYFQIDPYFSGDFLNKAIRRQLKKTAYSKTHCIDDLGFFTLRAGGAA